MNIGYDKYKCATNVRLGCGLLDVRNLSGMRHLVNAY